MCRGEGKARTRAGGGVGWGGGDSCFLFVGASVHKPQGVKTQRANLVEIQQPYILMGKAVCVQAVGLGALDDVGPTLLLMPHMWVVC